MCNVCVFEPGQMPKRDEFENMCYNNWHAFGLITEIDGKLDTVKEAFTPEKEMNNEAIWNLLLRDQQYRRILHVRHMTAGTNDVSNAHPFDVFYNPKTGRDIKFMHNGTLYNYKSKKPGPTHGTLIDDDSGPSDTKNFVDWVLTPALSELDAGNGHGDFQNKWVRNVIRSHWSMNNRGILIASDQDPLYLGEWKEREDDAGGKYKTANDDYFTKVTRGPEFTRREESRKKAQTTTSTAVTTTSTYRPPVSSITKFPNLNQKVGGFFTVDEHFKNVLMDWDIYDRDHCVTLGAMTQDEIKELFESESDAMFVFDLVVSDYARLYDEMGEVQAKHDRATRLVAALQQELDFYRAKDDEKAA